MEYEELANAIVIKAVDDYKKALKTLKNNPEQWRTTYKERN